MLHVWADMLPSNSNRYCFCQPRPACIYSICFPYLFLVPFLCIMYICIVFCIILYLYCLLFGQINKNNNNNNIISVCRDREYVREKCHNDARFNDWNVSGVEIAPFFPQICGALSRYPYKVGDHKSPKSKKNVWKAVLGHTAF